MRSLGERMILCRHAWVLLLTLLLTAVATRPAGAERSEAVELADLPARYRAILDMFSSGEQDRAVGELVTLESLLVEEPGGVSIKALWRSKLRVIRELLGAGNGILIPIALFHEQAYLEYLRREQSALATHSRIMAVELIEVYAADSEQNPDLALASNILTSLADTCSATTATVMRPLSTTRPAGISRRM